MGTLTYHLKFVPRISEQGQPAGSMPELSQTGACLQGGGGGGYVLSMTASALNGILMGL